MTKAAELIDAVLERVRDPGGAAHPRALVRSLLDRCQQAIQAAAPGWVMQVKLPTQKRQSIYPVSTFADLSDTDHPACLRVVRVTEGFPPRDLTEVPWRSLALVDRRWLRRTAGEFISFARLGVDLLVLFPGKAQISEVLVLYAGVPTPLTGEDTQFELRDDRLQAVAALTEILLLLRQRTLAPLTEAAARLQKDVARLEPVRGTGVSGFGQGGFGFPVGVE